MNTPAKSNHRDWIKSTYSETLANCVEVASLLPTILVRDSKDHSHPQLAFPIQPWSDFTRELAGA